jgi:hypothetical protein
VPALFGSLIIGSFGKYLGGGIVCEGRYKGTILPLVIVAAAYIIVVYVIKQPMLFALYQGFLMLFLIPVTWFSNKWLYKSGHIKVILPSEK